MIDGLQTGSNRELNSSIESQMSRRDFLKAVTLLSVTPLTDKIREVSPSQVHSETANVIIILFDALSAHNLSLYRYCRETTPNLAKFAKRATVYHSHYAAGNFTTPGTASLLTGTYPWTHRALHHAGKVTKTYTQRSLFKLFEGPYNRIAYPHNFWAFLLLNQFRQDIDHYIDPKAFSLFDDMLYDRLTLGDANTKFRSFEHLLFRDIGLPSSLFLSLINRLRSFFGSKAILQAYTEHYPRGIPSLGSLYDVFFLLSDVIDGIITSMNDVSQSFIAYYHLFPPHDPYCPRREFVDLFDDGKIYATKKVHFFSQGHSKSVINQKRRKYDEYIAYTDAEFGRLYDSMNASGLMDNSYIIITTDHGEMFERGVIGHDTQLLYEPVIHIPLLISEPSQQQRRDVHTPTNCVDLLPTLLQVTGQPIPDWCEGEILPGLGGTENRERSIFSVEAKENPAHAPLRHGTVALIRGKYKLIHYFGYPGYEEEYELYDLENDPEELSDLYSSKGSLAADLQNQLKEKLQEINQPYL
jgi:arylsulfatase A-like enzyme